MVALVVLGVVVLELYQEEVVTLQIQVQVKEIMVVLEFMTLEELVQETAVAAVVLVLLVEMQMEVQVQMVMVEMVQPHQ
jgi:hypothetical protein